MLPYPLTPQSFCSLIITDTAEQSCEFFLPSNSTCLNQKIMTNQPIVVEAGKTYHLQRDLLSALELSKVLYHADMAIHVAPEEPCRNSNTTCMVQWWKKSRPGKLDHGEGKLTKPANGQLIYTASKKEQRHRPTAAITPSSSFNLFMTEKQVDQRSSIILPHFKAQNDVHDDHHSMIDTNQPPGFDSDDPDADLEI